MKIPTQAEIKKRIGYHLAYHSKTGKYPFPTCRACQYGKVKLAAYKTYICRCLKYDIKVDLGGKCQGGPYTAHQPKATTEG